MRTHRVAAALILGSTLVVASLTLLAQGPPAGNAVGNLAAAVTNLQARVAALETTPPGAGGLKVLDANDALIGFWAGGDDFDNVNTMSFIDGHWLGIAVDTNGFVSRTTSSSLVSFAGPGCTGARYLDTKWSIARRSFVLGQTLHYAGDPIGDVMIASLGILHDDGSVSNCFDSVSLIRVGPLVPVDLATLGAAAPFRLVAQ
jgi:hypothetical protein